MRVFSQMFPCAITPSDRIKISSEENSPAVYIKIYAEANYVSIPKSGINELIAALEKARDT